jgi:hypothetical protein
MVVEELLLLLLLLRRRQQHERACIFCLDGVVDKRCVLR